MKLRTRQGSIRLRLTQGEVATLVERGAVEETVHVGPTTSFGFRLISTDRVPAVSARLEGAQLSVEIPTSLVQEWAHSQRVGIEGRQDVEGREALTILVEKDFACLEPRPGEDIDAFPHPGTSCA